MTGMLPVSVTTPLANDTMGALFEAPCFDDGFACTMQWLVDYSFGSVLVVGLCIALGFAGAVVVALVMARSERKPPRPVRPRKRILFGPVHSDGTWVRLVEDERGGRAIEVWRGRAWRTSSSDLSHLFLDVPVAPPAASR